MRNKRLLIGIAVGVLAVLAAVAVTAWFFNNFEQDEREILGGFSEKAIRNPLLAAERFLDKLGYDVKSVANVDLWRSLPPRDHAIVIYRFSPPAGEQRRRQLREWVESGGLLIVEADSSLVVDDDDMYSGTSSLLADLGVRVRERPFIFDVGLENTAETNVDIDFTDVAEPVRITLSNRRYLQDEFGNATSSVSLDQGFALLQYKVGDGLITVLSDIGFLNSKRIGEQDHAYTLALLVGAPGDVGVWLVHDIDMPSLWDLAWKYAPQALVSLIVLLGLLLWSMNRRLGPPLPPIEAERRDIGEHLSASANFLWRLDHARKLLANNQQQLEQAWLSKHYLLRSMNDAERDEWIAARTDLTPSDVTRALRDEIKNEREFIELSNLLQSLRSAL